MKKLYILTLLLISSFSFGQILSDDFNYTDNALLTANGWTANSGAGTQAIDVGTSNGLTYTNYSGTTGFTGVVIGNAAQLDNNGEDVNKAFAADVTTGTLYYSFLLKVTDATTGYFTNLGKSTSFAARVFVKPSSTTGKFNIGLSNSSTASYAATPTDYDLNTTYLIIVKYDVTTAGAASIWVKSSGIPATEVAAGTPEVTITGGGQATIAGVYLRQFSASQNLTIDGIRVYTTWFGATPCPLALDAETTTCNASTLAIDTYEVTIPFTGGIGPFTLSATAGTISGDDPASLATGTITISGVPEGTNVTLSITGGCTITKNIISPECKVPNTLPVSEPFNYTVGTALSSSQMWTNTSTAADEILAATGNLSYTGIIPTGGSIAFAGTGSDTKLPYTSTTTGELFTSFLVSVTDLTGISTTGQTYFASLVDAGNGFSGRIWLKTTDGTQYQYGISETSTVGDIVWSSNLYNISTTQYLVLRYDFTNNILVLFENPTIGGSASPSVSITPATAFTSLAGFVLRQDSANSTPAMIVDELTINTTANFTLSATSFNAIDGLTMYPNPSNGNTLYFTTVANAELDIQVYDMLGKQVINSKVSNNALNISGLNQGIYIVKVTEEGKTATRKLVVR